MCTSFNGNTHTHRRWRRILDKVADKTEIFTGSLSCCLPHGDDDDTEERKVVKRNGQKSTKNRQEIRLWILWAM